MQHLGVNFGGIWRFELFSLSGFLFFLLQKSGLIFNSPVITRGNGVNAHRPRAACGRVQCSAIQYNIILLRKLSERNFNKVENYRR